MVKRKRVTKKKKIISFNLTNIFLLFILLLIPIIGVVFHQKFHPTYYIPILYVLLADLLIITPLFLFHKTIDYAVVINSGFVFAGVMVHILFLIKGGYIGLIFSMFDFGAGYVLWKLNR